MKIIIMQFRRLRKPLRHPIVYTRQLINELKNDLITICGQANYDYHLIIKVNGKGDSGYTKHMFNQKA